MSGDSAPAFADLKGETLVKAPGSINGESFVIKNLEECSVFILDYSSEVEVTNCTNCQIFVGPVDGPAIFEGCTNCQVAAACHTFKADNCANCEFGIRIACWAGAYPQLERHFADANLDPQSNQWNKVYDGSAKEGATPNFELVAEPTPYWEVPLDEFGPPENPVPGPDGRMYQAAGGEFGFESGTTQAAGGDTENSTSDIGGPPPAAAGGLPFNDFLTTGGEHIPSEQAETVPSGLLEPAAAGGDHPAVSAAKQRLAQRLKEQAAQEAEQKKRLQATASKYLEQFYKRRNKSKEERIRLVHEALEGKGNGDLGPSGGSEPERIISMIDFQLARPNGTDLSRFKSVLFTCKASGALPTAAA